MEKLLDDPPGPELLLVEDFPGWLAEEVDELAGDAGLLAADDDAPVLALVPEGLPAVEDPAAVEDVEVEALPVEDDVGLDEKGDDALPELPELPELPALPDDEVLPVEDGLPDAEVLPVTPGLEAPADVLLDADPDDTPEAGFVSGFVSACLAPTFSAVRSIVTGRLPLPEEDGVLLPGLSLPLALPLPDEDVPPGDFLSVVISSPPEPCRSQDLHYTHLFAKRYRYSKDFCALQ
ncbi:hypothetical protein FMN63_08625 [Stappia sp. BW2]|uniref:hypothetical protein n=1 Tax=Stappia sp. BW2 TaxID=2592622 RepID=UPI0011DE9F45|nr:hypothetical protein [Stappia sp. BW2]TYC69973.1 hypothetical protein FMN63_08625 [Stappia sp. BW2]